MKVTVSDPSRKINSLSMFLSDRKVIIRIHFSHITLWNGVNTMTKLEI